MKLDRVQLQLLNELQKDSRTSTQELADKVGLSVSPCWRRVRDMEEAGIIRSYVALLDRRKVGLDVCVLTQIRLKRHGAGVLGLFEEQVKACKEVVECYELAGENDFLIKTYLPNMDAYAAFMHDFLLKIPEVDVVRTSVALREVKNETALPIG